MNSNWTYHLLVCDFCGNAFEHFDKRTKYCSRTCFKDGHSKRFRDVPQGFTNEKSVHWKADDVGYGAIHCWLKANWGKANKCENGCLAKRYEWALKPDKRYERKKKNFMMLCTKCHHRMDKIAVRGWKTKKKYEVKK